MRKKPEVNLRARALQYLARRECSRAELRGKLLPHVQPDEDDEFDPVQASTANLDALLEDLTARGWLSDERATVHWVHAKRSRFGIHRIINELRERGISESLISGAIPQMKETELAAARDVWKRKFGVLPQDAKEKARQVRFLQSRGFAMDTIFSVLRGTGVIEDE